MTEDAHDFTDAPDGLDGDAAPPHETAAPAERTGRVEVDQVLDGLEGLEGRPLAEHVTVFETAHDRLRGALATAGEQQSARPHPQG